MEMHLLTPFSFWAHARGYRRDLDLQILSFSRVIFLPQLSFKLFFFKKKERKDKTLLYLALIFIRGKEVAFAVMKEERTFKD